jgi:hypothetical protein
VIRKPWVNDDLEAFSTSQKLKATGGASPVAFLEVYQKEAVVSSRQLPPNQFRRLRIRHYMIILA